jgi:glycosyltransferase involved in cell wall biosynthesis
MILSVIVPVYNCKGFLPALGETAAALEGESWEMILVDDGSTDGSGPVCDDLARSNPRIRVIHKENGGVSTARNAGLDAAAGEYIGFLDADDAAKPHMYRMLIESACTHGSDMVMGGYEKVAADCRSPVSIPFGPVVAGEEIRRIAWAMAFWGGWLEGKQLPTLYGSVWPNLYRADLIRAHDLRFPVGIAIGEDLLFNLAYLAHVKTVSVVNEPLYEYNIANSSATRKQNQQLWQRYSALLDAQGPLLREIYGDSPELNYNLHRQRINYAINVGEEQICVFRDKKEAKRELKALCADPGLRKSAAFLLKNGKTPKERLQAGLIRGGFAGLIRLWLT